MDRVLLRILVVTALVVGPALLGCRGAWAGDVDRRSLEDSVGENDETVLRVVVEKLPALGRRGAYGFAALRFHNPHPETKRVSARLVESHGAHDTTISRTLLLEPESVTRIHLPIPGSGGWPRLEFRGPDGFSASVGLSSSSSDDRYAVLGVQASTRTPRNTAWVEALVDATSKLSTRHLSPNAGPPVWCDAESVPSDWRLLSGFDLIILNAGVADLQSAQQDALVRYVAGGGNLVLTGVKESPEGPFGRMMSSLGVSALAPAGGGEGRHGFGRWMTLAALHPKDAVGLPAWIAREAFQKRRSARPHYGGGIPTVFFASLEIPGLGEVPVQLFFLLILGFAVFVGPVTYFWLRRRRRLPWLAITIPVTGFLVSATILLYGFLSEGFGIRGAIRSFTVLDQETHEAATASGRTLYAGLAPSALVPAPGTMVRPPIVGQGGGAVFDVDLDAGGRIAGSALPSRTPTPFATMSVGRARERLRFRRREDGTFDVLHGPEFAPVVAEGAVLLRTFDGGLFVSDASGRLLPRPASGLEIPTAPKIAILRPLVHLPLGDRQAPARHSRGIYYAMSTPPPPVSNTGVHGFRSHFDEHWNGRLPRGAYLARVAGVPSLDALGLEVDYEAAEHLVLGFLAEEDIVE